HKGDNLTGEGAGDDETIEIELAKVPENVKKIVVAVTIHMAAERGQNFGQVDNSYIRLFNKEGGEGEIRYDLTEDFSAQTAVVLGEIYRHNGEWKMKAIGEGSVATLRQVGEKYGLQFS
ncbi:MAG: TerD family protein, partial [Plesiomonas sp.]